MSKFFAITHLFLGKIHCEYAQKYLSGFSMFPLDLISAWLLFDDLEDNCSQNES